MIYLQTFIAHPVYCTIIALALLVGFIYYLISIKKSPSFLTNAIAISVSTTLSILFSLLICLGVSALFSTQKLAYRSVFSIFYTVCIFPALAILCKKTFAKNFDLNLVTPCLLLTIFIARIACAVEGCCQGRFYLATIEELLCLTAFVLHKSNKLKISFSQFYIGYMIWRFFAEFFKESFTLERIGFLSLIQYVALIATLLATILLLKSKETKNEKH